METYVIAQEVYGEGALTSCSCTSLANWMKWVQEKHPARSEGERVVYTFTNPHPQDAVTHCSYSSGIFHEIMHQEHRSTYRPMEGYSNPYEADDPWLPIHLFLDDVRETPEGHVRCYTVEQMLLFLEGIHDAGLRVESMSLDNDLGDDPLTGERLREGHEVLTWIRERMALDATYCPPKEIRAHTANPVALTRMRSDIAKILEESSP